MFCEITLDIFAELRFFVDIGKIDVKTADMF